MKITGYILLFIAGAASCFFLMRGCSGNSAYQSVKDSLNQEIRKEDSIKVKNAALSMQNAVVIALNQKNIITYQAKIDSQYRVIAILKGQFKVSKDSISVLYANLKKFYDEHDTVALAQAYTNLATQLNDANNLLFQISLARDSADHIRNDEITRSHAVIDTLQSEITQFKGLLIDCTNNNAALASTAQKALKKSKINSLVAKLGGGIAALLAIILLVK